MKRYIYLILLLTLFSCKSDAELAIERGIQYFEWSKYNEAMLEFNEAKYLLYNKGKENYKNLELIAQTHYNLAITYAKLNNLSKAHEEAQRAYTLIPKPEYFELINLILTQQTKS